MRKPPHRNAAPWLGKWAPNLLVHRRLAVLCSHFNHLHSAVEGVRELAGGMNLRRKFLLSLALVIAALTCGTLLTVQQSVKAHAQQQVEADVRNSILTFQVMVQQQRMVLSRKAELLATLAALRNGDNTAIQDASQDPWQSEDCDLFAMVDAQGRITALQTRILGMSAGVAKDAIGSLLRNADGQNWWVSGRQIYQIEVRPYYEDPPINHILLGEVVVGREIDSGRARDLGRVLSSEVLFRYGVDTVVSSFTPLDETEISEQLKSGAVPNRVQLGGKELFTKSVELTPGAHPSLGLTVLKSDEEELASLARLNRMLLSLGLFAVLGGGAIVYVISDTFTRPLGTLVEGVHALEQGDFTYPLAAIGKDEVARVTRAFEGMRNTLERNEAQRQQYVTELKQLHLGTLTALARAIDAKSHWTAGHSERVTSWAVKIASAMGLSEHELEIIHRGGLLHDVGKIGIPRAILNKRGKLTDEEVRQVREHVPVGARILEPIPGFAECMPIILQHHEWVDGSGYPEGLAGGEISLHARIFAVADCYDALISDRPYRSGMSPERVKEIIRAGVGKQFDPAAVETFLSLLEHESREEAAEDVSTSLVGVA